MKKGNLHNRIFNRVLAVIIGPFLRLIFRFHPETARLNGPTLVISNHVTNYDPLLVSICFPRDHMHFVASEHLFRKGLISKFLRYVFDPIPRRKGSSGADTVMSSMRKLRAGRSVCIFAEGECNWDGITGNIFPATGRMAKMSGATLVTFRLEGGYLTAPRWGKGVRRGRMAGRVVGVYTPEQLKEMDKDAITALIQRDISENTWENQAKNPIRYRHRRRAENLQTVLYACPQCGETGRLSSKGKHLLCGCGAKWEFTELGTFAPAQPFETIAQWDVWQKQLVAEKADAGALAFRDPDVTVTEIQGDHGQDFLSQGELYLENGCLCCGSARFPLENVDDMALVQSRILLISVGSRYFQLRAKRSCCLRKYLAVWKHLTRAREAVATK